MPNVSCNLCGADDYKVLFPKGYAQLHQIVSCNRCGLTYANPQESIDCERFKKYNYPKIFDEVACRQYFQKQHVQLPDNLKVLRSINELVPLRGNLLEIGSFCGIFLDRIRADGWNVTGLEPDKAVADYSRAKYKLNVVDGVLPNPILSEHFFDAVVFLHVIEHMPDPAANLCEVHRILKKGGVLAVETPRLDSLSFKILGRRERSLSNCNGHIYFFTVSTLRQLLEKTGFEIIKIELVGRTLTLDRLFYNLGLISRSSKIKKTLESISRRLRLDKHTLHINVRDMQRIYARAKK